MAAFSTADSLGPTRQGHQLDEPRLRAYIQQHLPALAPDLAPSSAPIAITQFSHGQSNPTYLLTLPSGRRLVLRKKPPGRLLASAHAVEREYTVLAALAAGAPGVPVPRPLALCADPAPIGTPFYLMEFADGTIFLDPNLPALDPAERTAVYRAMAGTLARLHAVDAGGLPGLAGYGSPARYCARQLARWSAQYEQSVPEPMPEALALLGWLRSHVPADDSDARPARAAICHGDFRLDNIVFGPGLRPIAVLDWELSTLGTPWADLAYNCLPYHLPAGLPHLARLRTEPAAGGLPPGVPSEEQYVALYCEALAGCTGGTAVRPPGAGDWAFYLALSLFRLLAILAGVQARARQGNASSAKAAAVASDDVLRSLAQAALAIIRRADPAFAPTPAPAAAAAQPPAAAGEAGAASGGAAAAGLLALAPGGRAAALRARLSSFLDREVLPAEEALEGRAMGPAPQRWTIHPLMEQLKAKAKKAGLWNLWLPASLASQLGWLGDEVGPEERAVLLGAGLTHLEYAHLCELMGRSAWAPEVFNCSAPDTGNMEVLAKYGSRAQQREWLLPLLRGTMRSCFAMTEKEVASSDATNIRSSIVRSACGQRYELSGLKWWTSGAMDPRCKLAIFMGKTDPQAPPHKQQSMVLVPMDAPGVEVVRPMLVFGFDDAPHGHAEVAFRRVVVPATNMVLGEGRGFEIAQGRLGPGRLHHCMRLVGAGERALELMAARGLARSVFGGPLARQGGFQQELARARIELDAARLLVLAASDALDRQGFKGARGPIAAAKVAAPNAVQRIVDAAMQAHGAAGVSQDFVLARLFIGARTLRIADGPDEVHLATLAKLELAKAKQRQAKADAAAPPPASKL